MLAYADAYTNQHNFYSPRSQFSDLGCEVTHCFCSLGSDFVCVSPYMQYGDMYTYHHIT